MSEGVQRQPALQGGCPRSAHTVTLKIVVGRTRMIKKRTGRIRESAARSVRPGSQWAIWLQSESAGARIDQPLQDSFHCCAFWIMSPYSPSMEDTRLTALDLRSCIFFSFMSESCAR